MTWAFDVSSGIPRAYQSGTDLNLDGLGTAITNVPAVARSTAVTTTSLFKPPAPTGFWYRCSTGGITAATAPLYGTTDGGTTTDGTAVLTAFLAPIAISGGTKPIYFMPAVRVEIAGALTNANNQISTFTCRDVYLSSASSNFTSGAWASDGVTPLYDGMHFATTLITGGLTIANVQVVAGTMTLIGGEVQTSAAVSIAAAAKILSYYTRWRNTRVMGGVTSTRFRAYSSTSIFRKCEFHDMAYDLFAMPAEFSVVARDSEYVAQYVGSAYGGSDAYFKASALQNPDGSYDFDNYTGGYVELFNCSKGANLNVTSQAPSSKHCVPLYQDVRITARDTSGSLVPNVRFTATDAPVNSPTITITTAGNLKTWDFRSPLTYETTSNASGIALSSPILKVWYFEGSLKQNLRFPSSTVPFQGRAYNFKTLNVPVVLGSDTVQEVNAGMIALETATISSEVQALTLAGLTGPPPQRKFTFTPSGASLGQVEVNSSIGESCNLNELWDAYRAWISRYGNQTSDDTWTCTAGVLNTGAWTLALMPDMPALDAGSTVKSLTSPMITLNTQAGGVGTYAALSASTIALPGGANYQVLSATTQITGLPTTGVISAAGALGFGSSTITATGNLSISNTALSGTLTISTATARTLTLTSVTGAVTVNVTGGGSLTVVLAGTTAAGAVTTGAGATKAVQCSVAANGGNAFNFVKRYGTTGAFTDLGYTTGITSDAFLVPLGQPVEVAIWSEAFLTYTRTIQTTNGGFDLVADLIPEPDVDITLDVSAYLANIAVTYSSGSFTATCNANMAVPGVEFGKAILHRLLGLEGSMRALLPPGMSTTVDVEPDEIQFNKPTVFFALGAGATDVSIACFMNTAPAKLIDPTYIINPRRASDNLRVEIPLVKPALDVAAMAAAVWSAATRTLTSGGGSGGGVTLAEIEASTVLAKEITVASRLAASAYTAPDNAGVAAIKAKTDALTNGPTLAQIEASTVLAKEITVASRLAASAYIAPDNTSVAAIKAKTDTLANGPTLAQIEASTVLAKEITVASRLAASAYTAPDNTSVAAIKAKTDTLVNAPTLAQIEASTVLAKEITVASRSTLTADQIPAGLTAVEVWSAPTRTLTEAPGLTTGQAEQLRKVAQLHGVGAVLVVTETTRTAGDVAQTITTTEEQTTVSAT